MNVVDVYLNLICLGSMHGVTIILHLYYRETEATIHSNNMMLENCIKPNGNCNSYCKLIAIAAHAEFSYGPPVPQSNTNAKELQIHTSLYTCRCMGAVQLPHVQKRRVVQWCST